MDVVASTSDSFQTQVKSSSLTTVTPAADNSAAVKESSGKANLSQQTPSTVVSLSSPAVSNVQLYNNQGNFAPVNGPSNADEDVNTKSNTSSAAENKKSSFDIGVSTSGTTDSSSEQNEATAARFQVNENTNSQDQENNAQQNAAAVASQSNQSDGQTNSASALTNGQSGAIPTASSNNGATANNVTVPSSVPSVSNSASLQQQTPVANTNNADNTVPGNNSGVLPNSNQDNGVASESSPQNAATAKLLSAVLKQL